MVKVTQIILSIGCAGTLIFLAASCGGNEWSKASRIIDGVTIYSEMSGLWYYCIQIPKFYLKNCYKSEEKLPIPFKSGTDQFPGWLRVVRTFSLLAVLPCAGGGIMALLSLFSDKVKGWHVSIFLFGAAGSGIVALAVYTDKLIIPEGFYVGWSYILGWIGVVGAIGSGIVGIISDR